MARTSSRRNKGFRKNHQSRKLSKRNRRSRKGSTANLAYEALESKQLLAADLSLGADISQMINGLGQEITSPDAGEQMQIELSYSTIDLDANAEYRISAEYNGYMLESELLTAGAGGGTQQQNHTYTFAGWYTLDSASDIVFTLDSQDQIAESNENDNTTTRTIDPNKVDQYENVFVSIPDNNTTTSTIEINDSGTIDDLNVQVDILHTFDADLEVFLISPSGTQVELFTAVGSSGDNFIGTILDDEASTNITGAAAPFTGSFRPEGTLSDFDGESITGTWTLEVSDVAISDTGALVGWGITAETSSDFSSQLTWPVAAEAFTEIGIFSHVDVDPTSGSADFMGGSGAPFKGATSLSIATNAHDNLDRGIEVLAAANGTVVEVSDRYNNRPASGQNFMVLDHGDGWQTRYNDFRRDSIQFSVGDTVNQGDFIALMGEAILAFSLTHHGRPVESMIAPQIYHSAGEFEYVFGVAPASDDSSTSNDGSGFFSEGGSTASTFKIGDQITYAASISSLQAGDTLLQRLIDPSGNVAIR